MHLRAYIYLIALLLLSAVTAFTLQQPDNETPNQAGAAGSPSQQCIEMGFKHRHYLSGSKVYSCSVCRTHMATIESMISRVSPSEQHIPQGVGVIVASSDASVSAD